MPDTNKALLHMSELISDSSTSPVHDKLATLVAACAAGEDPVLITRALDAALALLDGTPSAPVNQATSCVEATGALLPPLETLITPDELASSLRSQDPDIGRLLGDLSDADPSDYLFALGVACLLDPEVEDRINALGIAKSFTADGEETSYLQGRDRAAAVLANRRAASGVTDEPSVAGLADLGSLDDEPVAPAPVPAATVTPALGVRNDDEDGDEVQDLEPRPVDLVATVATTDPDEADEVLARTIPSLAEVAGAYWVTGTEPNEDGTITGTLEALADSEPWLVALPAGTTVFDNPVPGRNGPVNVTITVAGEIDPANPPLVLDTCVGEILANLEATMGIAVPPPTSLILELERLDGRPFGEAELAVPMRMALANLAQKLGPVHSLGTEVGDTPAIRLVTLALDGEGDLDARGLVVGAVGFQGSIDFPGLGMVRARLVGAGN